MMRRVALWLALLALALPGAATALNHSAGSPVPPAAQAAGYTTLTFSTVSNFTTSTYDQGSTYASGFQWYNYNFPNGVSPGAYTVNLPGDGTIQAYGTYANAQVASAGKIATAPYFVGEAFGCGAYIEGEVSFDPSQVNAADGFPSFWQMSQEHLVGDVGDTWNYSGLGSTYRHYVEHDFEFYKNPQPYGLHTLIDWYGIYGSTCAQWCKVAISSSDNFGVTLNPAADWKNQWHRVGTLWIPATSTTPGSMQDFVDDQPVAPAFTWTQFKNDGSIGPPPTSSSPWLFGIVDLQHLVIIFGSADTPINVRAVRVFQGPSACNVTN